MPRRKPNIYRKKGKLYRKKRKNRGKNYTGTTAILYKSPVPRSKIVKMRYCENLQLDTGATVGAIGSGYHIFRANGIYDPNASIGGHQPLGHDEWVPFYNHSCVIASKITVDFGNQNGNPVIAGITLLDDTTAYIGAPSTHCERSMSNYTLLGGANASSVKTLTLNCAPLKYLKKKLNDSEVQGDFGVSDPTEQVIYQVWIAPALPTAANILTAINVTIDYVVMLTEPKELIQS